MKLRLYMRNGGMELRLYMWSGAYGALELSIETVEQGIGNVCGPTECGGSRIHSPPPPPQGGYLIHSYLKSMI